MRDGPIRTAVKRLALACFVVNLRATRAWWRLRGDKPFELGGSCGKCAACCEAPGIQVDRFTWYIPTLRRMFLWWHRHVNGFVLLERVPGHRLFVFRCTHFDPETRRCDSYHSRPGMCRDYPRALMWQSNPEMLPGCGYRPVACGAERFIAALQKEGLTGEELEKVKRKLHLEEQDERPGGPV